jgi:hypothetical protein
MSYLLEVRLVRLNLSPDFVRLPAGLVDRRTAPNREIKSGPVPATEWRKTAAHGVSRGFRVLFGESPGGAPEKSAARPARILSPLRGYCYSSSATHGSRRGLFSVAAPRLLFAGLIALFSLACLPPAQAAVHKTQNVLLIISDGFRWQEVFNGAEADLMTKENGGVQNTNALRAQFWRDTPEARREALLPFFWNEIARHGQLFGNQDKGSVVTVTNGKKFSYPGYNEILTGAGDPRIDSNDKTPNANTTVFEWLNGRSGFHSRVTVFGTWDVFPYIFNIERSQLPVWPAWESKFGPYEIAPPQYLADLLRDTTPMWEDLTYDAFLFHAASDYLKRKRPRLVFVGFGETDEWAHAGRYDHYLTAAHHMDDFVRRLWETAQSLPQYRDKTTFIITADHGRGSGPQDWKNHGKKVANSESDWIAVIGPDTPPVGERTQTGAHTQSQIAATIAALLGEDYHAAFPRSGAPIDDLVAGGIGTR